MTTPTAEDAVSVSPATGEVMRGLEDVRQLLAGDNHPLIDAAIDRLIVLDGADAELAAARNQVPTYQFRNRGAIAWTDVNLYVYEMLVADGFCECRTVYLTAHVPAQPAADVADICNAYESGVGHAGRPTAKINPYREGTCEHEAYALGASRKGELT